MTYDKLVSVVMPVHNGEKYLREAIESVLSQTYTNFEFLIIENCSIDSSLDIIKSYNDSRIRIIIEKKCGIPFAYNKGFREAKGQFIVIHDQDDVSLSNRIESQLNFILKNNIDICGSAFLIIDNKNQVLKKIFPPQSHEKIFVNLFFDFFSIFNPTLMIKKKVLSKLDYFNERLLTGSDYDFLLRSFDEYKVGNINEILLKYRYHKNSTSKTNKKYWKNDLEISLKYFEKYRKKFDDEYFVLSRIFFFYGLYGKSVTNNLKSIFNKGPNNEKIKYLLFSTVFVIPLFFLRKSNIFFNKSFNSILTALQGKKS